MIIIIVSGVNLKSFIIYKLYKDYKIEYLMNKL